MYLFCTKLDIGVIPVVYGIIRILRGAPFPYSAPRSSAAGIYFLMISRACSMISRE